LAPRQYLFALAQRERFPDVNLNLGVMPRGELDPMWLAGVSVPLPIWSYRKQGPAVHESEAMSDAAALGASALEQNLRLRVAERHASLQALLEIIRPYREGLLVQSQATADSTLCNTRRRDVRLGLEPMPLHQRRRLLTSVADAHRVAIASRISLNPISAIAAAPRGERAARCAGCRPGGRTAGGSGSTGASAQAPAGIDGAGRSAENRTAMSENLGGSPARIFSVPGSSGGDRCRRRHFGRDDLLRRAGDRPPTR
jgi:hypothetical protein